ncbi:hypothetical protein ACOSQ3_020988 [Xanthoceras sorbifolium]
MGSNFKMSIGASLNFLQETGLNHARIDCNSSWTDVIQIDTWMYASGKNGLGRDWHVQDFKTGKTLIRATSVYLMMDKKTRKVFKFIEEAREEIKPFIMLCDPIIHNNSRKLLKVDMDKADQVRTGLIPGWTDMDVNQHLSHIKHVNYALELQRIMSFLR